MHDYRKFKVSVNGRIGRTARLSERLRTYVTSNLASPATRWRATPTTSPTWPRSCSPCAMRARTTWSSSAPGVLERLLAVGALGEQHPHAGLSTQLAHIANVASSRSYDLNSRRCAVRRSPAWPAGGARRSTRAPQSTPVAAAQPHASGPSSCGRPPVQSVRRPLRHLVACGSTNKYRPVNRSKASGNTAKRPTLEVYFPCTTATMLTMTATVKALDSQRWVCRTHLFQFNDIVAILLDSRLLSRLRRPVGRFNTELLCVLRVQSLPAELHGL